MTTYYAPGGAYVNTHAAALATEALKIGYCRNVTDFPINRYLQIKPVKVSQDKFLRFDPNQPIRVQGDEFVWANGKRRPHGRDNLQNFAEDIYRTTRYSFGYSYGLKTGQEADWDLDVQHSKMASTQAMTKRTTLAQAILQNASNYGSNTGDAGTLAGGSGETFATATSSKLTIKKAIHAALKAINLSTAGVVKKKDLLLLVSYDLSLAMAATDEIHNYLKGSYSAAEALANGLGVGGGLPPSLYGIEVVCENSVRDPSKKGSNAQAAAEIMPNDIACIISRPGDLINEGVTNAPTFSSLTMFELEAMTAQSQTDTYHRIVEGAITDDYVIEATALSSAGYLITGAK